MKPLWLKIIEKKRVHKVSPCIYIIVIGRTDFVHPLFPIISSQSCFIEMDLLQKVSLGGERKKCYIFKIGEQSL